MPVIWLHFTNKESGGRIPVMVEWDWSVLLLKEAISSQLCRTSDKLIFGGRELYNEQMLSELGISELSTVDCELATPCVSRRERMGQYGVRVDSDNGATQDSVKQLSLPPRRVDKGEQRTEIPASPAALPILDPSAIHVEVEGEYYVQMRQSDQREPYYVQMRQSDQREPYYLKMEQHDPYYVPMKQRGESGVFDFSFIRNRRYEADSNSIASGSDHQYESLDSFALHYFHLNETRTTRRFFSVYCRDVCRDVTRGKLLVRCWSCRSGQFMLSRDPCCWDDVTKGEIAGVCCSCRGERAEFYFKCANHTLQESLAIPLRQVKMNEKGLECIICGERPDRLMVFQCPSGHVTCLPCFREYSRVNLLSRQFRYDRSIGYSLGCPAGCSDSLVSDQQHFRLLGEEMYQRLQRFAAEEYVLAEGGVLCPSPRCGEGLIPSGSDRLITCESCYHMFCRRCMLKAHFGACEKTLSVRGGAARVKMRGDMRRGSWRFGLGDRGVDEEGNIEAWIESSGVKSCPSCNTPVDRDGGCAHMKCPVGVCQFEWCWACEKQWHQECREDHWFD